MNNVKWFLTSFFIWISGFIALGAIESPNPPPVPPTPPIVAPITPPPPPAPPVEPDCVGVQVPIPKNCRVYNRSGSQCVWCSLECLARHHNVKELYEGNGRLTKNYTWATGPGEVQRVLNSRYSTVKWKQIQNRGQLKGFIKTYVCDKKFGIGLGIPGHMLNLVHYDEEAKIVKIIDNGGPRALQIQDWSMEKFERLADGWAVTVFPPGYIETIDDNFNCSIPNPDKIYGLNVFASLLKN
jgi:hypothetical protein